MTSLQSPLITPYSVDRVSKKGGAGRDLLHFLPNLLELLVFFKLIHQMLVRSRHAAADSHGELFCNPFQRHGGLLTKQPHQHCLFAEADRPTPFRPPLLRSKGAFKALPPKAIS